MFGAIADYDRAKIRQRLRDGRKAKAARGGYAYGAPPVGKRSEGRALVADPDEAATVARIRALDAQGAASGRSPGH